MHYFYSQFAARVITMVVLLVLAVLAVVVGAYVGYLSQMTPLCTGGEQTWLDLIRGTVCLMNDTYR